MIEIIQLKEANERILADLMRLASVLHGEERRMTLKDLETTLKDPDVTFMVARDEENIIGMGAIYLIQKIGNRKYYLEDLIVDERYRGQGVGGKIVHALTSVAREQGAMSVELMTRITRTDAHRFYEKLGFKNKERIVLKLPL